MSIISIISQMALGNSSGGGSVLPEITNPLFIFMGESNSNGEALNTDATVEELAPTSAVRIGNIYNYTFADLDIGTNNVGDFSTTHGWELQLANLVRNSQFSVSQVHLVKTGYGGTRIVDWIGTAHYTELSARINGALSIEPAFTPIGFLTIGINDALNGDGTADATYKSQMIQFITDVRADFGATIPFIITKLPTAYNRYDNEIEQICSELPYCWFVEVSDLTMEDLYHWNYSGMKTIADRMITALLANYTI